MAITARDIRLLFQQSGNRCAFPSCVRALSFPPTDKSGMVATSEVAHIVGESLDGPRGDYPTPLGERDRYENLILLCEEHHHVIDTQVATYPVERLRQMKYDHEGMIAEVTRKAVETRAANSVAAGCNVVERLFSSLLPVERLPRYIFSADFEGDETRAKQQLVRAAGHCAAPFICRGGRLYCFQNLRDDPGPFADIVRRSDVERDEAGSWWRNADRLLWYVTLLNRTLNKITGRRGLNLDREHHRYFFQPDAPGKPKSVPYRPMNQSISELQVVWQPITKKTNQPKHFWYHRAVAMNFVRVGERSWCLAMRPEMRVTKDGVTPLEARKIGGRVTKKKSKMWNIDVLEELNFWRAFFFEGQPRLVVPFSPTSALSVSANFLSQDVRWPGVPPERAKSFKNAVIEEDMFGQLELEKIDNEDDSEGVMPDELAEVEPDE